MEQRIGGYESREQREERREKREGEKEEWITLRHAVMRCAVLCYENCFTYFTSAVRRQ